jgi:hypothetical protein
MDLISLRNEPFRPRCTKCTRKLSKESFILDCGHFLCEHCSEKRSSASHGLVDNIKCPICHQSGKATPVTDRQTLGKKFDFIHIDPAKFLERAADIFRVWMIKALIDSSSFKINVK